MRWQLKAWQRIFGSLGIAWLAILGTRAGHGNCFWGKGNIWQTFWGQRQGLAADCGWPVDGLIDYRFWRAGQSLAIDSGGQDSVHFILSDRTRRCSRSWGQGQSLATDFGGHLLIWQPALKNRLPSSRPHQFVACKFRLELLISIFSVCERGPCFGLLCHSAVRVRSC